MLRLTSLLLMLSLVGCGSEPEAEAPPPAPFDRDRAIASLMSHANIVREAVLQEDHEKLADLTHPALMRLMGNRLKFIERIETMASEMRDGGMQMHEIRFAEFPEMIDRGNEVYAIVPHTISTIGPDRARGFIPAHLIGYSSDRGETWQFIGHGVEDRETLLLLLPGFPDELQLPPKQTPIFFNR